MAAIANETCRGRGRPQIRADEATLGLIVQAAREEFQANGYVGATICAMAQRAGVSTKTLYRLTPNKADLFKSVVSEKIERFIIAFDEEAIVAPDMESALVRILIAYGHLTLELESTAIIRLVLSECDRFPEIAEAFFVDAMGFVAEAMARWLKEQCRKGLLELEDPYLAAGALRGMMIMEPQRAVMLGQRAAPDADEIAARAKRCAALFLKGCIN
ncbi:TetR/AcrR family transcriptional regulator [Rhodoblastus sp.]|jgi:AcrR family transcriptional regulator|uniref:TetR/AcrR family transcriptional regulator n=1 Tax=Rhodoblastus sp. TaxID=1962975 RepID=UPI0025F0FC28|nr:TetR/AcrR family transcriptional regulator [Rhodoblastus sp.]